MHGRDALFEFFHVGAAGNTFATANKRQVSKLGLLDAELAGTVSARQQVTRFSLEVKMVSADDTCDFFNFFFVH